MSGTETIKLFYVRHGNIDHATAGWTFTPQEDKAMTFNSFEGHYANKGGKLLGPEFDTTGKEFEFMRFSFEYATPKPAYAGVFFQTKAGAELPDVYAGLDPSDKFTPYELLFYGREDGTVARPFFQSVHGISARNAVIEPLTHADAALYCDRLYQALPPLRRAPAAFGQNHLPKTFAALATGKPWRVVMLGDSIVNDSFNSGFQALLKRQHPQSDLRFVCSVRGSTGCGYYHLPEHFQEDVHDKRPDLLIIGGISNQQGLPVDEAVANVRAVVEQARERYGCEVLLLTGPLGLAWQEGDGKFQPPLEFWAALGKLATEQQIAFQDQGSAWREYLAEAGKPRDWFSRDTHHGNARGEQIVARMLETFFAAPLNNL